MRAVRFIAATVVGFALYEYAVVYIGGVLAAVAIPREYFAFWGRQYAELGHAVLSLGLHALPTTLLVAGGVLATHRLLPTHRPNTWVPVALGMLGCLLLWLTVLSPAQMQSMGVHSMGPLYQLRLHFLGSWWVAPNVAAPWLGVALAAWLISRSSSKARPAGP